MKALLFNGSPNASGNTYSALSKLELVLNGEGISTEIVQVGNQSVATCRACKKCIENQNQKCVIDSDPVNEWIQMIKKSNGIILGSPVHFCSISAALKAFLDRSFYVEGFNNGMFRHKVGAGLIAVRRSGGVPALNQINNYFNYSEMIIPSSNYWNIIHGNRIFDIEQDHEGMQIIKYLGLNIAWVMKTICNNDIKDNNRPQWERKILTNFIR